MRAGRRAASAGLAVIVAWPWSPGCVRPARRRGLLVVIVMLHELGHFVAAKRAGMKVTEYFVGFGPRLWSFRRGETEYGIKALPLGGYVQDPRHDQPRGGDPADEARAYREQPFHPRILVAVAGSAMHFLMAFVLLWVAARPSSGVPNDDQVQIEGLDAVGGRPGPAAAAGLDPVTSSSRSTASRSAATVTLSTSAIRRPSAGRPVHRGVDRDGPSATLTVTPANGRTDHEAGSVAPVGHQPRSGSSGSSLGSPRPDPVAAPAPCRRPVASWAGDLGVGRPASATCSRPAGWASASTR